MNSSFSYTKCNSVEFVGNFYRIVSHNQRMIMIAVIWIHRQSAQYNDLSIVTIPVSKNHVIN